METRRVWSLWWSGVFAVAAFVHLLRALANLPVTMGTVAIPMWVSWVAFPVAGVISGGLMWVAFEKTQRPPPRPPPMAPTDAHPTSAGKRVESQSAGHTSCGI